MAFSDFDPPSSWYSSQEDMDNDSEAQFAWNDARRASFLRWWRQHRLIASDWTQMPDSPLSAGVKEEWRIYREWLRNLPAQIDLENVEFISSPGEELVNPWSAK